MPRVAASPCATSWAELGAALEASSEAALEPAPDTDSVWR